jgi:hypothetical protein
MRTIKFRRAFFFDEEKTKFSHFTEWGVGINGASFTSPSTNNFALYHEDNQFIGLYDRNKKEVYEGDFIGYNGDKEHPEKIEYKRGGGGMGFPWDAIGFWFHYSFNEDDEEKHWEVVGNIYENEFMFK